MYEHGFFFQGWCFIPLMFCFLMMLGMVLRRGRMPFYNSRFSGERERERERESKPISNNSEEILKIRLVKGEITIDEYEKMKKLISQ